MATPTTTITTTTTTTPVMTTTTAMITATPYPDPTTTMATTLTVAACIYEAIRLVTANSGQQFLVRDNSFNNDGAGPGGKQSGVTEIDCLDSCASVDACVYFTYSPNYAYFEIFVDGNNYWQKASGDFRHGREVISRMTVDVYSSKAPFEERGGGISEQVTDPNKT